MYLKFLAQNNEFVEAVAQSYFWGNIFMLIRLATLNDISEIMIMISELVPLMNASGNFQ